MSDPSLEIEPLRRADCPTIYPHAAKYGGLCVACAAITATEDKGASDQKTKEALARDAFFDILGSEPKTVRVYRTPIGYIRPKLPTWLDWLKGWFKHA